MIFTSFTYLVFFVVVFCVYWTIKSKKAQNVLLLLASYVFYGWVTQWFCILIATSTIVDYFCGRWMVKYNSKKIYFLLLSLICNLGLLGVFKYFNFFSANVGVFLSSIGFGYNPAVLDIVLPVGISFYTFQTLSYSIDIYRNRLLPQKDFINFALFVSFFPQLVAGPIERARNFLPQIENTRVWDWEKFDKAWPLIVRGLFKKLVIADNIAFYVDKVFMMQSPDYLLLGAGTVAFSLQIYADFSGYTDIARGTARMFGFELIRNFNNPYLAVSPSDFWRRWHISLSTWIRDYLYIPLGGNRYQNSLISILVVMFTMLLCGLWHGAAWNFIIWGGFHGLAIYVYRICGCGGSWYPTGAVNRFVSWLIMISIILFGWLIFRSPSIEWLIQVLHQSPGFSLGTLVTSMIIMSYYVLYVSPLMLLRLSNKLLPSITVQYPVYAVLLVLIVLFHPEAGQDFIYFQF